jgi:hypothetical protein
MPKINLSGSGTTKGGEHMRKLQMLVLIAIVTLVVHFQARSAQAQGDQDTRTKLIDVQLGPGSANVWDPVWITKVEIGNQFLLNSHDPYNSPLPGEIIRGQNYFIAGNDWLKNTTLHLINRTELPIAWLSIKLMFPQTGNGHTRPMWIYNIQMGRMPDVAAISGRTGKPFPPGPPESKYLGLQPGGRLTIHVSDYMDQINNYLKTAMPVSALSEVDIQMDVCIFENGLRYSGAFAQPDPQHPGQWIYMPTHSFFPGNLHKYLPNVVTRVGERPQQ